MKYKVWGKATAVLKPRKHHFEAVAIIAFAGLLIAAIVTAIRLGMLYSGTIYVGVTEPYLQMLGSDRVTIVWQSTEPVNASIELIEIASGRLLTAGDAHRRQHHEITITGLLPSHQYQYRLLQDDEMFRSGDGYTFQTAAESHQETPVRIWMLGDPGHAGPVLSAVKNSALEWMNSHPRIDKPLFDLLFTTGDNAYENATHEEYQQQFFSPNQQLLRQYPVWPVYGNHDARGWSFFNLFALPSQAELGGVASLTERYYSFDYANIHFIFLDTNEGGFSEDDEMLRWLQADLQQTNQLWTIVMLHHPAYTRGSHNSNDAKDSGSRMFNVRKRILPVLEKAGVDLMIAGHSHSYERSELLDCHYGLTADFEQSSVLQKGPVFKLPLLNTAHDGMVHVVMGSSAYVVDGKLDHPALPMSNKTPGSMLVDIDGARLEARYIADNGEQLDYFVMTKSDKISALPAQTACQQQSALITTISN